MHCSWRRLLRRGLEFHVCTINKSAHTKSLETYWLILVYIYIYIKVNMDSKSDSMKKAEKQNIPNRWIYCDVKTTSNVSVSITFIRTLISEELFPHWWTLVEITGANKMYTKKKKKKIQHFQISFHVPNTYLTILNKERYLHVCVKVLMKVIETETFNVDFTSQKIHLFGLFCFSAFFSIYIYNII